VSLRTWNSRHTRQSSSSRRSRGSRGSCLAIPSRFAFFARKSRQSALSHHAGGSRGSRIPGVALGSHEALGSGGTPHTGRSTWSHGSNLCLHVGEGVGGGALLPALALLYLVEEGLDVRLRSGRAGHARCAGLTCSSWGSGATRLTGVAGTAAGALQARGAEGVNLLAGADRLGGCLVGAHRAAFPQGHIRLSGTVLHVRTLDTRASIRIVYAVINFHPACRWTLSGWILFLCVFVIRFPIVIAFPILSIIVIVVISVGILWSRARIWIGESQTKYSQPQQQFELVTSHG